MKHDVLLAQDSWRVVRRHYARVSHQIDRQFIFFDDLIEYIQRHDLDKILHAETSHDMLIISTQHRYDAAVDKIRIELQQQVVCFEYFSVTDAYRNPQVIECKIEHFVDTLQSFIAQLLDSAKKSLS